MKCRHCKRKPVSRPRGLCWNCYYTPGVRQRYSTPSKFLRLGITDRVGRVPLPELPTHALPGSPEKIAVLEERARKHQQLFHPLDAVLPLPQAA